MRAQDEFERSVVQRYEAEVEAQYKLRIACDRAAAGVKVVAPVLNGVIPHAVAAGNGVARVNANEGRKKVKKRPRDKVLRDRATAVQVMEYRKRGAFLGYAYRNRRELVASIGGGAGSRASE